MVLADARSFIIGQTVYHRDVYEHGEPLKIVGILEDKLLLEGDFSGGTNNVCQRGWLPIKGVSRIENHAYKLRVRNDAITIQTLAMPVGRTDDNTFNAMMDMVDAVLCLTSDVLLNPEY